MVVGVVIVLILLVHMPVLILTCAHTLSWDFHLSIHWIIPVNAWWFPLTMDYTRRFPLSLNYIMLLLFDSLHILHILRIWHVPTIQTAMHAKSWRLRQPLITIFPLFHWHILRERVWYFRIFMRVWHLDIRVVNAEMVTCIARVLIVLWPILGNFNALFMVYVAFLDWVGISWFALLEL